MPLAPCQANEQMASEQKQRFFFFLALVECIKAQLVLLAIGYWHTPRHTVRYMASI